MVGYNASFCRTEDIPEDVRRRALYRCYTFILSLPSPREKQAEPDELLGEAAGSDTKMLTVADVISPDITSEYRPTGRTRSKVHTERKSYEP